MDRRKFLKGLLCITAVTILPAPKLHSHPIFHGDGIHDDTDALQALFNRETVVIEGKIVKGAERVVLSGGKYRTTKTLIIYNDTTIQHCHFVGEVPDNDPIFYFVGEWKKDNNFAIDLQSPDVSGEK